MVAIAKKNPKDQWIIYAGLALLVISVLEMSLLRRSDEDLPMPVKESLLERVVTAPPVSKKQETIVKKVTIVEKKEQVRCGGHFADSCAQCPFSNGGQVNNGESWCNGECEWEKGVCKERQIYKNCHPEYKKLLKEYPFQPIKTEKGDFVNIIGVRAPLHPHQKEMFLRLKDQILFLGISSFESFPMNSPNPYSANFSNDEYRGLFEGFLTMMHEPQSYFESHVKTILLSQSDFNLDPALRYGQKHAGRPKRWGFTYSGSDQEVWNNCVGWSSFAKNWSFVLEALEVMCSPEFNMTGVLAATKKKFPKKGASKDSNNPDDFDEKRCTIPAACDGKIEQTFFLPQDQLYNYAQQSHFVFLPQIYDASPRVSSQALSLNTPILMNRNILGGWKYVNDKTGEFFHDMSDFKQSLRRILDRQAEYEPAKWISEHFGNRNAGVQLRKFVDDNWPGRVKIPEGTRLLIPEFG